MMMRFLPLLAVLMVLACNISSGNGMEKWVPGQAGPGQAGPPPIRDNNIYPVTKLTEEDRRAIPRPWGPWQVPPIIAVPM